MFTVVSLLEAQHAIRVEYGGLRVLSLAALAIFSSPVLGLA